MRAPNIILFVSMFLRKQLLLEKSFTMNEWEMPFLWENPQVLIFARGQVTKKNNSFFSLFSAHEDDIEKFL